MPISFPDFNYIKLGNVQGLIKIDYFFIIDFDCPAPIKRFASELLGLMPSSTSKSLIFIFHRTSY